MNKLQPALLITVLFIICSVAVSAQKNKFQNDSTYYETFPDKINIRVYLSQKYVHLNIPSGGNIADLEYKANRKLNLGAGFSYKWITVNLFNGFSFLNTKDEPKGKTTGLGLQIHLFPKKWAIDLTAELPKGFHLEPKGMAGAMAVVANPGGILAECHELSPLGICPWRKILSDASGLAAAFHAHRANPECASRRGARNTL